MEDFDGRIIMLILFVVISAIKWFMEKVKNQDNPHETSESLEEIYDEFREEIRQRQTEVQHPQDIFTPHHHEFGQQSSPPPLPPASEYQPEYQSEPIPELKKVKQPKLSLQEEAALARLKQRAAKKRRNAHRAQTSLRGLLASPQSARQAIVLHEILGQPKSTEGLH